MLDIDDLRNGQIRMHGLAKADEVYTFYHDETNNIKKLRVGPQGFNVATVKVFVLGGVVHTGAPRAIDIQPLRDAMRIQKSATEIKLEHVAKGEFLDLLRSTKLTTFLRWIAENGFLIHYHDLDPLFWSVVDIIDSILPEIGNIALIKYHMLLKSDLAAVLNSDVPVTAGLFHRYGYPGLAPESRKPFLDDLLALVEGSSVLPAINAKMLTSVIRAGRGLESLDFIEGNAPHLLIDDLSSFYISRIAVFKNSTHILDMEDSIRDRFLETPLTCGGVPVANFRFADSKAEVGIQLSDIVAGMLGKMHSYFTGTPRDDVAAAREALTGTSLENSELLRDLIAASHAANVAFLHHIASVHEIDKLDLFLRFRDGSYAA